MLNSLIDYFEKVNEMEDKEPKDKRSKEYKAWKKEINKLFKEANELAGYKVFVIIK